MRYLLFGRSGLRVSELCLGTMTFGEDWGWGASQTDSRRIFEAFVEAGGNLGCLDLVLADEPLRLLDDATRVPLGFPHEFLASPGIRDLVYGGPSLMAAGEH